MSTSLSIKDIHFKWDLSIEKVKAFCMEYCNDDQMRVVIKSNQTF